MPFVKSPVLTPCKLAANRSNARHSTGPRALEDVSDSTLNTMDRSIYSRPLFDAMADLEEDPSAYQRLFEELLKSHHPQNAAQRMLVEDLAWLRLQERTYDREVERKVNVLMRMQKAGTATARHGDR